MTAVFTAEWSFMFYYLNGELTVREPSMCVIDYGGVGYKLTISQLTSEALHNKINQKVKLLTYFAVREDEFEIFGFLSNEERSCFNHLISVSGVGPKAAMNILSSMTPDAFSLAVCTEDVKAISKAPGVGAKTAARIILELKDKLSKDLVSSTSKVSKESNELFASASKNANLSEATEALMVLGYDKTTVLSVLKGIDTASDVGEIIRLALKKLAR